MALIDQATPLLALFLRLSAATGARRGEVCALRWDDLDLGSRLVHIHRSVLQLPGKEVLIKDTKTHRERTVSIDAGTAARLATRRAEVETALEPVLSAPASSVDRARQGRKLHFRRGHSRRRPHSRASGLEGPGDPDASTVVSAVSRTPERSV